MLLSAILLFVVVIIYLEFTKETILIDAFEVPKSLEAQGYTGRSLANKLIDKLNGIEEVVRRSRQRQQFVGQWLQTPLDLEAPGFKISVRPFITLISEAFSHRVPRVVAEVTEEKGKIALTARVHGTAERSFSGTVRELDRLLLEAAKTIYSSLRPADLAVYYYLSERDYSAAFDAVVVALRGEDRAERIKAYTVWGELLAEEKRYDDAIEKFQAAIAVKPRSLLRDRLTTARISRALAYTHDTLGILYAERLAKYADAIVHFEAALRLDPKSSWPYVDWGFALDYLGDHKGAVEKYQQALKLDHRNPVAHNNLGALRMDNGEWDTAIKKFYDAILYNSGYLKPYINWADVLWRLGRDDEANAKLGEAAQLIRDDPSLYIAWGDFLRERKLYRQAEERYNKAAKLARKFEKKNPGWAQVRLAEAYSGWALTLEMQKRYTAALEKYQAAIKVHPFDETGHIGAARVLWKLNRDADAVSSLSRAVEANRHAQHRVLVAWADLLLERDDVDNAITKYKEAVDIKPRDPSGYRGWGKALRRQGVLNEAVEKFNEAINVAPGDLDNRLDLAEALAEMNRLNEAVKTVEEELKLNPRSARAYLVWGVILGKTPEALEKYDRALAIDRTYDEAYERKADTLLALGDRDAARATLQKSCQLGLESGCKKLRELGFPQKRLGGVGSVQDCDDKLPELTHRAPRARSGTA